MEKNIRFYDNEEKNWTADMSTFEDHIDWFHVDETTANDAITNTKGKNHEKNQEYIDHHVSRGNTYAAFVNNMDAKDKKKILDKEYPNNGIDDNLAELNAWIGRRDASARHPKILLFDWDRTITVVEGMQFSGLSSDVKFEDIIEFVMGGRSRFRRLQQMIDNCFSSGVQVYFITHNPNARYTSPNRRLYLEMINELMNRRVDPNSVLFASGDYGFKKHNAANAALPGILTVRKPIEKSAAKTVKARSRTPSPPKTVKARSRSSSPSARSTSPDYSKMKKDDLMAECRRRGIACNTKTLKEDLVKSLSSKKGGKQSTRKRSTRRIRFRL
jgi:hypothetical protein